MKRNKYRQRAGFTLIEVVAVIAIVSILAAVAIPSMVGFIEHGKQVNRMNIARTLYLSIQNQFTKSNVEKNLKSTMTGLYFEKDINDFYTDMLDNNEIRTRNVADLLSDNFPIEEAGNKDYIHYISLPKNYVPLTDIEIKACSAEAEAIELRNFYYLIDEIIIDKSILKNAILVEYNILTGVVLSVFYGDAFDGEQIKFEYKDVDINDRNNVTGGRGIDTGYQYADQRKQGYYGVESTGEAPPPNLQDIVNIYDGKTKPLEGRENILYVELLLPQTNISNTYTFEIINNKSNSIISCTVDYLAALDVQTNFDAALLNIALDKEAIYRYDATLTNPIEDVQYGIKIDLSGSHYRYIWIIDYIDGDILTSQPYSINRYTDESKPSNAVDKKIEPQEVRARVSRGGGTGVKSLTAANTYFNSVMSDGTYEIKSARHLNNIRYAPNESYRQTDNINMQLNGNKITNFDPIDNFSGKYYAMKDSSIQWKIENLVIDTSKTTIPHTNVGLFANVSGNNSSIQGLSLYKAEINATYGGNVGAIVGKLDGGIIKQCNSYANIAVSGTNICAGGLVGNIKNGTLDQSFNAGFYDALTETLSSDGYGSVTAINGSVGGLVGFNEDKIQNSFNNARVNVKNVTVTDSLSHTPESTDNSDTMFLGGIAGSNNGTINNTYATNFVADGSGSNVGGITGSGNGSVHKSFFLSNGCSNSNSVSKDELKANPCGTMFVRSTNTGSGNIYKEYPYPLLRNNNPFGESIEWGWEDILGENIAPAKLTYYEIYNDGTCGFSNSFEKKFLVPNTSKNLVVNDGYAVEFSQFSGGYKLCLGIDEYTITMSSGMLTIKKGDDDIQWPYETFSTTEYEIFRLYIPNSVGEIIAQFVNVQLYKGSSGTEILLPENTKYNPFFAPTANGVIRSPRHIDNIDKVLDGVYTQQLNVDFSIYYKELINPSATLSIFTEAIVKEPFTGTYNGNSKTIANLTITALTTDNIGLFAMNSGTIKQVTMVNPSITGKSNVGAIVGTNQNSISFCSVQQTVNLSTAVSTHPAIVTGAGSSATNVGGVVGLNSGTLTDVALVSTSGAVAVRGISNVGGIVGQTNGIVDRIMYLAVAPRIGTGANAVLYPFAGSGIVGANKYYLSGTKALRPYQTHVNLNTTTDYNYLTVVPDDAKVTLDLVKLFDTQTVITAFPLWSKTLRADADIVSQSNTVFPYPYPNGTAQPSTFAWPIVDDIILGSADGIVYYEKYADGTNGVFTRRKDPDTGVIIDIDYLNNNGNITESGYAVNITGLDNWNANRQSHVAYHNGTSWVWQETEKYQYGNNTLTLTNTTQTYAIVPLNALINFSNLTINKTEPFVIWIPAASSGKREGNPLSVMYINPLFAKEIYVVEYNGPNIISSPVYPKEHFIRTPWQMQNISKATGTSTRLDNTAGHKFIQEFDLSFNNSTTTELVNVTVAGSGAGVRPVITTTTTANIVMNTFQGTYNGNGKIITELSLINNSNNKGLFNTVGVSGIIENLTMYNCTLQNGTKNGGFASVNNGTIRNVAFVSSNVSAPVNGTNTGGIVNAGGIVYDNQGLIENTLYIAHAPGNNPIAAVKGENSNADTAYYLSGSKNTVGVDSPINNNVVSVDKGITTQELNALQWNNYPWTTSVRTSVNTMLSAGYPYPFLGAVPSTAWLTATIPAERLAYYEEYSDGTMGFYAVKTKNSTFDGIDTLDATGLEKITSFGYCAIVPRAGGYSVRLASNSANSYLSAVRNAENTFWYVKLPTTLTSGSNLAVQIYVNDIRVEDENSRFINTRFAKALFADNTTPKTYAIRTEQQMRNISILTAADVIAIDTTFIQERDLDFNTMSLTNSIVTENFKGIYDGGGRIIANVMINSSADNIGLFSQNSGTVRNITLDFGSGATLIGTSNVGGIAGINNTGAIISDVTVVSTGQTAPITGENAGGIAGVNEGEIARVLYLALAPNDADTIYPIAGINDTGTVTDAYYLSGTVMTINPDDGVLIATDYNTMQANIGTAKTTEDMYALDILTWTSWETNAETLNVMLSNEYPYPYISTVPKTWPVVEMSVFIAYYEKYHDDTYGYFVANSSALPILDDTKLIVEAGYSVIILNSYTKNEILINETNTDIKIMDGRKIAQIELVSTDKNLTEIFVNNTSTRIYINMLFAKALYTNDAASDYYIRTPEQMRNIGLINDAMGKTFKQERDLDFYGINLDTDGAVIKGEFTGSFDGRSNIITGVTIECGFTNETSQGLYNVGLFSKNSGTIENVTLRGSRENLVKIVGKENVGGIAGHNLGIIQNCVVEGIKYVDDTDIENPVVTYEGMHIEALDEALSDNTQVVGACVGGIVGVNDGTIDKCTVRNTTQTIKDTDYVGCIAGLNGVSGIISGAVVTNVRLEVEGENISEYDKLVGTNNNLVGGVD